MGGASPSDADGGVSDASEGADLDDLDIESGDEPAAYQGTPAPGIGQAPTAPEVDSRTARPEPFEHAFGAQAHPAEPAASDPGPARVESGDPGSTQPTTPADTPSPVSPPAVPDGSTSEQ